MQWLDATLKTAASCVSAKLLLVMLIYNYVAACMSVALYMV